MKGLSVNELKGLENKARQIGLQEGMLIENASSNLFSVIDSLDLGKRVLIIAGRGNNGADVLSCARKMISRGYHASIAVLESGPLRKEAAAQKEILTRITDTVYKISEENNIDIIDELAKSSDFILEGILGIGLKGEVHPLLQRIISLINDSGKRIVSCDIPSGLHPDEGVLLGAAVRADYTVTFLAPKKGFFTNDGPKMCGQIITADIGVSRDILERV